MPAVVGTVKGSVIENGNVDCPEPCTWDVLQIRL
jgi:hypothetical protein